MTAPSPLLDAADLERLREALTAARYTGEGITARLGTEVTVALGRNDFRAVVRATADAADPLATLVRLFVCGTTEPEPAVAAALRPLPVATALAAGLVERAGTGVRAAVDLHPYEDWWLLADQSQLLRPGPLRADHVLGVGGASSTLALATIRTPVDAALDLGTGCGVQALHLSQQANSVTATDVNPRALRFAATTAALNGLSWELLAGDLAAPVAGRRFDLVVSNPPFVIGPTADVRFSYRDSGRAADAIGAELVAAAPDLLTEGGYAQFLANWLHVEGEPWSDRVAGWLDGTGLDAWVLQREVTDPAAYVALWLGDAGEAGDTGQRARWLDWFAEQRVEAIGFGLVTLRRGGHADPTVRIEELRHRYDQPLGTQVLPWFAREDWLRAHPPAALLDARLVRADALRLHQVAVPSSAPDSAGWEVGTQRLLLDDGLRWSDEVDPLTVMLVSGCTGALSLREQLSLLAAAHEVPEEELAATAVPIVCRLVERGMLLPAGGS